MIRNSVWAAFLFIVIYVQVQAAVFVSPSGLDTNPGTIGSPVKTLTKALTIIDSDSLIYMRGGTYAHSSSITISKNGNSGRFIKIWAYENEVPILDFATQTSSDGVKLTGTYIHLKGLHMINSFHNGLNVSGHYNRIENCKFYGNKNTGCQMGSQSSMANPSNNLFLNCDAYKNYDAPIGGNADGFGAKWNIGTGNVYKGCRAYNNSDDGWDLWMANNTIVIDSCMAFRNGVDIWHSGSFDGNGNGFKLGGNNIPMYHLVRNCVSFDNMGNGGRGFDENNNLAGQTLYNCTAFRNEHDNFHFTNSVNTGSHIIKNCIAYPATANITSGTRSNNSWQGFTVTTADFISIDTNLAVLPRNEDGSLQETDFLRLASGSLMINAGTDVGIPYRGSAPDLGAYETVPLSQIYSLSINSANGDVSKYPDRATYDSGMSVQLTATPATGYHFVSWSDGAAGTSNPVSVLMDGNKTVTANFAINQYALNVSSMHGTITKSPDLATYDYGTSVIISATASPGWRFSNWSGDVTGSVNPDTVTMDNNKTISVNFIRDTIHVGTSMIHGWNMVSLPVEVLDPQKNSVFPTAVSNVFSFEGSYVSVDTIENSRGYWVKFSADEEDSIQGFEQFSDTINVVSGWNLIGSISTPVDVSSIIQTPDGIVSSGYFGYNGSYQEVYTILPGQAYWVKVDSAGTLILHSSTAVSASKDRKLIK